MFRTFSAAAVAAITLAATPASAAIMLATFSGSATGYDDLGFFGGGDLSNVAFEAGVTYSSDGPDAGLVRSAYVTINGYTLDMGEAQSGGFAGFNYPAGWFSASATNLVRFPAERRQINETVDFIANFSPLPPAADVEFDVTGDVGSGSGIFSELTWHSDDETDYTQVYSIFDFDISGLKVTAIAVPEPSTWALMIAGFGIAGAALRRRHPAMSATR